MSQEIRELILSRAELVYVLNALQASRIVGVDLEEFSWPREQFTVLLEEAEQSLIASSLLKRGEQTQDRLLAPLLLQFIGALAFRDLAIVLVRGLRDKGQQLFVFNRYENIMVEHTQPQEDVHRLALVDTLEHLRSRVGDLIPLHAVVTQDRPELSMAQAEFEQLQQKVRNGNEGEGVALLTAGGMADDMAAALVEALRNPLFTLSLALLKCEQETVIDAYSVAVFADEQSAWGLWPGSVEEDAMQLRVFPTGINDLWQAIDMRLGGQEP